MSHFERDLAWIRRHMPLTRAQLTSLPAVDEVRLACSIHLEPKMTPVIETVLERGAAVFLTSCNRTTVRDDMVDYLVSRGAEAHAWNGMSSSDEDDADAKAIDWKPTHLCEMGAALTSALVQRADAPPVRASLEATGSGITRLETLVADERELRFPIFNWDDLPIKEGLHNRYLVGLSTWQTFSERTRLSLHGKRVVVVGFGLVGHGIAESARAFGGTVSVAERDAARLLQARYAGFEAGSFEDLAPRADVIVTATGVKHVLNASHFPLLKDGAFLMNVGHNPDEIEVDALPTRNEAVPFVEEISLDKPERTIYLLAGGSMANLTAGRGDTLNAFDLTLATMVAGLGFIFTDEAQSYPPGVTALPEHVWQPVADQAVVGVTRDK